MSTPRAEDGLRNLARAFYGDDPVLRHSVLADTTSAKGDVVLFVATRPAWAAPVWRENQGRILTTVIDAINAVPAAAATSPRAWGGCRGSVWNIPGPRLLLL